VTTWLLVGAKRQAITRRVVVIERQDDRILT